MHKLDISSLEGAQIALRENRLSEWIHTFLVTGPNPNLPLSAGLQSVPTRTYLEPVLFPLSQLTRVCGPEAGMQYVVDQAGWERKVATLVSKIKSGWNPQPLLSPGYGTEAYTLRDGSHRYEALVRAGIKEYWVIFFFDSEEEKALFYKQLNKA